MTKTFYQTLAADYDQMIPWGKRLNNERPMFQRVFEKFKPSELLDASCGTGRHLVMFAEMGLNVTGTDASPEMIALARKHTSDAGLAVGERLFVCTWSALPETLRQTYDIVLCIGNSLPYVTDDEGFRGSMNGLWQCVASGGVLLIQFKNFAKLIANKQRFLPITSAETPQEMIALRLYDYHRDRIDFNVILLTKQETGWGMRHQVTALRPYRATEVQNLLASLGAECALYGTIGMDKYVETDSEDVVITAHRR